MTERRVSILSNSTPVHRDGKRSSLKNSVTTLIGLRRMSRGLSLFRSQPKQLIKLENTYKTQPDDTFPVDKAYNAITHLLEPILEGHKYDAEGAGNLTSSITNMIKSTVKSIGPDRFKYVVQVVYGQANDQGFYMASRALCDPKTDNFTSVEYRNDSIFLISTVHAIYLE